MKVLILGGTGVISRAIVHRLLDEDHDVTLYNRGNRTLTFQKAVKRILGDRCDRDTFRDRFRKETFDAVIDMICFDADDARSTIETFRGKTAQMVICSSVAAYRRPYRSVPTREAEEEFFENPVFGYSFHKAEAERYLKGVVADENLPVTIIRPSLTYGIGAVNIGVLRQNYGIVHRIRNGKPLIMFGDGATSWSWTFAPDLAKAFVGVLGNEKTYGQAYHATSEERRVWDDLYLEFGRLVGKKPRILHLPSELLYQAAPNLCNHLYFEKTFAGLFDNSKIKRDVPAFSIEMPLRQGLEHILKWWEKEANRIDPEKEMLEDRLVNIFNHWSDQMKNLYTR